MRKILCITILGVSLAGCVSNPNQLTLGSLGAAAGGLLGNQVGAGKGKTIATAAGAVLGLLGGSYYGNRFDTIGNNSAAISDLYTKQNESSRSPTPMMYQQTPVMYQQAPVMYQQAPVYPSVPMHCTIRNNYTVCNSR